MTAIVILNWNGKDFLEKFLPGLLASVGHDPEGGPGEDAEVIVADNASTDGSREWLRKYCPSVRIVQFRKNHGFTGGYNRAFDILMKDPDNAPEYFLLINSDIEVTDGWLYPLKEWMEYHPECAVCGPKLRSWYNRDQFEYAGAAGGYLDELCYPLCRGRVMDMVEVDEGQYDDPEDVLWASGACLMVRSRVWKELKGLDDRFFAHMEEIDFCWRARNAGYRVNVVPRSIVYHVGGGTLPQNSPFKLKLNYRNNLLMMQNNLAASCSMLSLYDLLVRDADDFAICTDDYTNCLEVLKEAPESFEDSFIEASVRTGCKLARSRIRLRMFLDCCSALVYLLKGRRDYAKAVREAHKEFRQLRSPIDPEAIALWLREDLHNGARCARTVLRLSPEASRNTDKVALKGFAEGLIVPLAPLYKERVFDIVDDATGK